MFLCANNICNVDYKSIQEKTFFIYIPSSKKGNITETVLNFEYSLLNIRVCVCVCFCETVHESKTNIRLNEYFVSE